LNKGANLRNPQEKRSDIQVLRGIAVTSVLLYHANESLFPLGFAGVDVFFVVSGFVVTPLILGIFDSETSLSLCKIRLFNFYRRRFFRLAPALAVVLVISVALIFFLGPPDDHPRIARQAIATILILGNLGAYTYGGNYFSPNPMPFVHTWSLSVEEQIYLFLPLFVMGLYVTKKYSKSFVVNSMIIFAILSILSFLFPQALQPIYSQFGIQLGSQFSFYSPFDRLWEFLVGALGYLYQDRLKNVVLKFRKLFIFALLLSLFSPFALGAKFLSMIVVSLTIYIILSRSLDSLPKEATVKLVWLGDRSYSIYLIHLPLIYLAQYSAATGQEIYVNRTPQTVIALLATILLGSMSYSRIENKFRKPRPSTTVDMLIGMRNILLFIVTPLIFFSTISLGSDRDYWGLNKNVSLQSESMMTTDKNCQVDRLKNPACDVSLREAKRTVLLIGDSHAGHYADALISAAKATNWNVVVWWHGGCRFEIAKFSDSDTSPDCIQRNLSTVRWISKNKPQSIIVSQYVHNISSQLALRDALIKLTEFSPNVLIIGNNPIFPDDNDYMVSRPLILKAYVPPKRFELAQMDTSDKSSSDELMHWAQRNEIQTLSVESMFCDSIYCHRFSREGWLYRDVDHLSIVGAIRIVPKLQSYLRSL